MMNGEREGLSLMTPPNKVLVMGAMTDNQRQGMTRCQSVYGTRRDVFMKDDKVLFEADATDVVLAVSSGVLACLYNCHILTSSSGRKGQAEYC